MSPSVAKEIFQGVIKGRGLGMGKMLESISEVGGGGRMYPPHVYLKHLSGCGELKR